MLILILNGSYHVYKPRKTYKLNQFIIYNICKQTICTSTLRGPLTDIFLPLLCLQTDIDEICR